MFRVILLVSVCVFVILAILVLYIHQSITRPVLDVKRNLADLSLGKTTNTSHGSKDDVIGEMVQALNGLNSSFARTSEFANEIGHGNLDASFAPLSQDDRLGNALLSMRSSLKAYSEEMEQKVLERTVEIERQKAELIQEKKKSDELLLNILPQEVATELILTGAAKARRFESVTVMFTDFKDFTKVAERLSPEELVAEIDFYFRKFDEIATKYHIEKIKTIGDAYMCAAGLPQPNPNAARDMVLAALEIMEFMQLMILERAAHGQDTFHVRIGIHCGPVVAGIVGMKKFAYDIWGDAVNIAARMEQNSEVGKINISQAMFEKVGNEFKCTHRGKIDAKNKGVIDMYFVERLPQNTV